MLNQLLETKQVRQSKPLGTIVSVVLHIAVIAVVTQLSQRAVLARESPAQVLVRVPVEAKPTPPVEQPKRDIAGARPDARGFTVLSAPTTIEFDIPAVDLSAASADPDEFRGVGVPGSSYNGRGNSPVATGSNESYFDFQVEKVAASMPGSPMPTYPELLKSAGVEGEALVQFIVDTLGRAELASFKVLRGSHDEFGTAVQNALPRMRFLPAEINGRKVRMVVQQPFSFALSR